MYICRCTNKIPNHLENLLNVPTTNYLPYAQLKRKERPRFEILIFLCLYLQRALNEQIWYSILLSLRLLCKLTIFIILPFLPLVSYDYCYFYIAVWCSQCTQSFKLPTACWLICQQMNAINFGHYRQVKKYISVLCRTFCIYSPPGRSVGHRIFDYYVLFKRVHCVWTVMRSSFFIL